MAQHSHSDVYWDATVETPYKSQLLSEATMLCFGIVWHPDPARIGAIAPVCFDRCGTAALSRLTPDFHDQNAPLLDRHISRSKIILERDGSDRIAFTPSSSSMSLTINGINVVERRNFALDELGNEIILMLGHSVILSLFNAAVKNFQNPAHDEYGLIGISHSIAKTRASITQFANTKLPVLILGETGTGKELVARALHSNGSRANAPLTTANVAAITPSLATAEFFGSKKGAFTGALADSPGLFVRAHKGTLFLDEIGDASADVQAILLRTLETGEVMPVGGTATVDVDVRIIAATDKAVAQTEFNQPLFQRLNGATIALAPLRHRRVDIGLLIKHFLQGAGDDLPSLAPEALSAPDVHRMLLYDWPGNVRQLYNAVRRIRVGEPFDLDRPAMQAADVSSLRHQPAAGSPSSKPKMRQYRNPLDINDEDLLATLDSCDWVIKSAARQLGVSRTSLYLLMSRCEAIRSIDEVSESEITEAMASLDGGISAWAKHLKVGRDALRKRILSLQTTRWTA